MSRHREAPLVDPAHDPRRDVGLQCAAAFLRIDARTLRSRIESGQLHAWRDGKVYRIRVAALVRYKLNPPDASS